MMMRYIAIFLMVLLFSFDVAAKEVAVPDKYKVWLEDLKKDMVGKGISKKTIKEVYPKGVYRYIPIVLEKDKKQPEFMLTTTDYLNRLVTKKRVDEARLKYKDNKDVLKKVENKYDVPANYLVAFWGLETNFGSTFGGHKILDALTTLSYDNRRSDFFKKELYQALKIVDESGIDADHMEGSWAGAMGHFQFMPSTYNEYAVDWDNDGKADIWDSFADAAASAANYLSELGWKEDEPWGGEVSFDYGFEYGKSGYRNIKKVKNWKKLGVLGLDNFDDGLEGAIIIPEGRKGKAYIVFGNFRRIMTWNRSENYALAIVKLADYVASKDKWVEEAKNPATAVKTEDVLKLQKFINKHKIAKVDEDGVFGSKTKEAVKALQKKMMMPQDGYPDYRLMNKLNKYNPKVGFGVPMMPKKPVK